MKIVYIYPEKPHLLYIQQTETKWRLHTVSFHLKKKLLQYYHVFCFRFVLFDDRHWDIYTSFLFCIGGQRDTKTQEETQQVLELSRKKIALSDKTKQKNEKEFIQFSLTTLYVLLW